MDLKTRILINMIILEKIPNSTATWYEDGIFYVFCGPDKVYEMKILNNGNLEFWDCINKKLISGIDKNGEIYR